MLAKIPAGELMDSPRHAPVHAEAEVIFSDLRWRPCTVVAWARHRGNWAILIQWPDDGHEEWRQFDRRLMRPRGS